MKAKLNKKRRLVTLSIIALFMLLSIFVPTFFIVPFVNTQVENVLVDKSFVKSYDMFSPEVVVFTEEEDGDIQANFVKLKRRFIVAWEVDLITTQEVENKSREQSTEEVVKGLTDEIKEGRLVSGNNADVDKVSDYDKQVKEANDAEYTTLARYTNEAGNKTLALNVTTSGGTYLTLNGQTLPIQDNVASPAISPLGDRVCYSKYYKGNGEDSHSTYSGKVFCMDTGTKHEEEIYSFGENTFLSIGVNQKYILYSLSNGEIGVVNLATRQKTKLVTLQMLPESDPSNVIFMSGQSAIVDPNDYKKLVDKNKRMINIDLDNLTFTEK